jgi:hypothetical protein
MKNTGNDLAAVASVVLDAFGPNTYVWSTHSPVGLAARMRTAPSVLHVVQELVGAQALVWNQQEYTEAQVAARVERLVERLAEAGFHVRPEPTPRLPAEREFSAILGRIRAGERYASVTVRWANGTVTTLEER